MLVTPQGADSPRSQEPLKDIPNTVADVIDYRFYYSIPMFLAFCLGGISFHINLGASWDWIPGSIGDSRCRWKTKHRLILASSLFPVKDCGLKFRVLIRVQSAAARAAVRKSCCTCDGPSSRDSYETPGIQRQRISRFSTDFLKEKREVIAIARAKPDAGHNSARTTTAICSVRGALGLVSTVAAWAK